MAIGRSAVARHAVMRDSVAVTVLAGIVKNIRFNTKSQEIKFQLKRYLGYQKMKLR